MKKMQKVESKGWAGNMCTSQYAFIRLYVAYREGAEQNPVLCKIWQNILRIGA